jgi:hypothetical protein
MAALWEESVVKPLGRLSIGVQSGPLIGAQKGPPWGHVDGLKLGAGFALLAA